LWDEYTKSPSDIYDKEEININSNVRKERFKFDLHGFTLDDANKKVKEIIFSCAKKKI
jgi:DNA-nicking Smr family endonuclease